MEKFVKQLETEFEEDNFHFMATIMRAIRTKDTELVIKAHDIMNEAYNNPSQWGEMIEQRELLNKEIRNKLRIK